jgi:hypothetical protein
VGDCVRARVCVRACLCLAVSVCLWVGVRLWSPAWEELVDPPKLVPIIAELLNDDRFGHSSPGVPPNEYRGKFRLDHVRAARARQRQRRQRRGREKSDRLIEETEGVCLVEQQTAPVDTQRCVVRRTTFTLGRGSCLTTVVGCTQATPPRVAGSSLLSTSSPLCLLARAASAVFQAHTATTRHPYPRTMDGASLGTGQHPSSVDRCGPKTCQCIASRPS